MSLTKKTIQSWGPWTILGCVLLYYFIPRPILNPDQEVILSVTCYENSFTSQSLSGEELDRAARIISKYKYQKAFTKPATVNQRVKGTILIEIGKMVDGGYLPVGDVFLSANGDLPGFTYREKNHWNPFTEGNCKYGIMNGESLHQELMALFDSISKN